MIHENLFNTLERFEIRKKEFRPTTFPLRMGYPKSTRHVLYSVPSRGLGRSSQGSETL